MRVIVFQTAHEQRDDDGNRAAHAIQWTAQGLDHNVSASGETPDKAFRMLVSWAWRSALALKGQNVTIRTERVLLDEFGEPTGEIGWVDGLRAPFSENPATFAEEALAHVLLAFPPPKDLALPDEVDFDNRPRMVLPVIVAGVDERAHHVVKLIDGRLIAATHFIPAG